MHNICAVFFKTHSPWCHISRDKARWDILIELSIWCELGSLSQYCLLFMNAPFPTLLRLIVHVCMCSQSRLWSIINGWDIILVDGPVVIASGHVKAWGSLSGVQILLIWRPLQYCGRSLSLLNELKSFGREHHFICALSLAFVEDVVDHDPA
jgi:hypothetical protein